MLPNARSGYWGLPGNWTMKLLIFRWKQRRYAVDLGIANGSPPPSTAASARLCSETGVVLADRQGPAFLLVFTSVWRLMMGNDGSRKALPAQALTPRLRGRVVTT